MSVVQLRGWQENAFQRYLLAQEIGSRSLLWEATPGAGKTTAALEVVRHQLRARKAQSALIVVPTAHLRIQWARAAARIGLKLDSSFGGRRSILTSDFHGAIVTYQQCGNRISTFRKIASQSVTVLDEVHHAGDGLSWGNALRASVGDSRFILCLSGTAFRSDSNSIPFVSYSPDGVSIPDYTYGYADAVRDQVCRPTAFFTYGGEIAWNEHDRIYTASFTDQVDPLTSARRLRAALNPESGWIQPMLRDAHTMLTRVRREHARAGGLVVCADQQHARQVAQQMIAITGEKPTMVLSDDSTASRKIKDFSESSAHWIVACNMVSEGVDIPRLRVGVYATTIRTKLYFRQFLGRVVRVQSDLRGRQVAYVYLPADPVLHLLAQEIESEIRHSLNAPHKTVEFPEDDFTRNRQRDKSAEGPTWSALNAFNSGLDAVIVHGNQLSFFSSSVENEQVQEAIDREVALRLDTQSTHSELKQQLSVEIKNLVGKVHKRAGKPHSEIHTLLNKIQSVRSQTDCTEQQLRQRVELLETMIEKGDFSGRRPRRSAN